MTGTARRLERGALGGEWQKLRPKKSQEATAPGPPQLLCSSVRWRPLEGVGRGVTSPELCLPALLVAVGFGREWKWGPSWRLLSPLGCR